MLAATAVASPPLALMPFTTSSHAGSLRLETMTLAPCAAICSQIERPMPRLPPVTTATLPERSNIIELVISASLPLLRVSHYFVNPQSLLNVSHRLSARVTQG